MSVAAVCLSNLLLALHIKESIRLGRGNASANSVPLLLLLSSLGILLFYNVTKHSHTK